MDRGIGCTHKISYIIILKQDVFVKHECPCNAIFFKLWPWYLTLTLTLTLVVKKEFYSKEYIYEIWKLFITYHSKAMANIKVFVQTNKQTKGQAKNYMPVVYRCGCIKKKANKPLINCFYDWGLVKFKILKYCKSVTPKISKFVSRTVENIVGKQKQMLVTSIFFFFHNVFRTPSQGHENQGLFVKLFYIILLSPKWNQGGNFKTG